MSFDHKLAHEYPFPNQNIEASNYAPRLKAQDQIDPFAKQIVDCQQSRLAAIAQSWAWHLSRLPDDKSRRSVIIKLGNHVCLECGSEKLPCFCIADQ